jgi:hypothetical protein
MLAFSGGAVRSSFSVGVVLVFAQAVALAFNGSVLLAFAGAVVLLFAKQQSTQCGMMDVENA